MSTRPSLNPTYSLALNADYRKALYLADFAHNVNANGVANNVSLHRHRIDLDVSQVQFKYHRLFSGEHLLAYRLRDMFHHFKLSEEQNLIDILKEKVRI